MTPLDLESLRGAMGAIASARETLESEGATVCAERLDDAHYVVEQALTELTARRARDAEVEAVVAMLADARDYVASELADARAKFMGYEHASNIADIENDLRKIDAALRPFHPSGSDAGGESK